MVFGFAFIGCLAGYLWAFSPAIYRLSRHLSTGFLANIENDHHPGKFQK
jgi:hypothetical protein